MLCFCHMEHLLNLHFRCQSYILIFLSVCDGAWVRHRRPTGPDPALPDSRISTDRARCGGCRAGSVTEGRPTLWSLAQVERARSFSGSQHGRCGHGCSLVPSTGGAGTGGAGTAVFWFPARAECGLEEEHCAAAGERRRGGGQRREEKKRRA